MCGIVWIILLFKMGEVIRAKTKNGWGNYNMFDFLLHQLSVFFQISSRCPFTPPDNPAFKLLLPLMVVIAPAFFVTARCEHLKTSASSADAQWKNAVST